MTSTTRTLAHEITGVVVSGHCMPARVTLHYNPDDAYAITLRLRTKPQHPGPGPEQWLLSRDLLAQGLVRASGEGDVRLRPLTPDWILLDLAAEVQTIMLMIATPDLRGFLDESYALVPEGAEAATICWEAIPRPVGP